MAKETYDAGFYAQAIFQIAQEKDELDTWQEDLRSLSDLGNDATIVRALENASIDFSEKVKIVSALETMVNPLAMNLIYLLITNRDLNLLESIAGKYRELRYAHEGIELAEVTTAIPLDEESLEKLGERLSSMVDKKIQINPTVDPELIGGFIARIGDKIIDGSTRSRLIALKQQLTSGDNKNRNTPGEKLPRIEPEAA